MRRAEATGDQMVWAWFYDGDGRGMVMPISRGVGLHACGCRWRAGSCACWHSGRGGNCRVRCARPCLAAPISLALFARTVQTRFHYEPHVATHLCWGLDDAVHSTSTSCHCDCHPPTTLSRSANISPVRRRHCGWVSFRHSALGSG
jgi:hypothetical protein